MSYRTIHAHAQQHPSKTAVVYNGNVISYADFARAIGGTIDHIKGLGIPGGQTVVVRVNFLVDCWVVVLALQELGMETVCVSDVSVVEGLSLPNVACLLTTELDASASPLAPGAAAGRRVTIIPNPSYTAGELPPGTAGAAPGTGGHILYTSGTTGSYKKVFLDTALQEARNAERIQAFRHYGPDTVYHCLGFGLWTAAGYKTPLYVWQAGGAVVLEQRPQWYEHFIVCDVTNAILVPDQVRDLLAYLDANPAIPPFRNAYLIVASGFISNAAAEQLKERVSPNLENAYGATEINAPVLSSIVENPDDLHWLMPSGCRDVEVVNEDGVVCATGVEGQLRIRCTELDCAHYLDAPQASAKMFDSGYFYPGDMAVQREDGRIRILGRSVDVVNILGQKQAAAPIEQRIQQRLGVNAVCLFSSLNSRGETEYLIAIESGSAPVASEANDVLEQFSRFGVARMERLATFPRTRTGTSKIDRIALRKLLYCAEE